MNGVVLSAADISKIYNQVFSDCSHLGVSPYEYDSVIVTLEVDYDSGLCHIAVALPSVKMKGKREQ